MFMEQKTTEAVVEGIEGKHYRIRLRLDQIARSLKSFDALREIQY